MRINKILLAFFILSIWSCQPDANDQIKMKSLQLKASSGKISLSNQLNVQMEDVEPDSIHFPGIQPIKINDNTFSFRFKKVGKTRIEVWALTGTVWLKGFVNVEVYSDVKPAYRAFEILETYNHDSENYTQGLEFHQGKLYESTGRNGKSKIVKMRFPDMEVEASERLNLKYFGEGITILKDTIYQLTWQSKKVLLYDLDLNRSGQFELPNAEGWGICNDGRTLWISDGSHYLLNTDHHLKPIHRQAVYSEALKIDRLNELEYVDGIIWANVYYSNQVVQIDPKTGVVLSILDLSSLRKLISFPQAEVLNGIAYLEEKDAFLVTGKLWEKSFLIRIK